MGTSPTPGGGGKAVRRRRAALPARRRRAVAPAVRRRRAVALAVLATLLVAVVAAAASARDDDPFTGVWWEPSSGRRVEIVRGDDGYTLLYGAQRRPFAARRRGDAELRIAAPLGGDILVRAVADDRLELVDGGMTTTLERLPEGR